MNKKGFTLVELLAVIAVMAVLVITIAPNIIESFKNTKKQNFISETREVCRSATNTYLRESIMSYENKLYNNIETNPENTLELQGRKEYKYAKNTDKNVGNSEYGLLNLPNVPFFSSYNTAPHVIIPFAFELYNKYF